MLTAMWFYWISLSYLVAMPYHPILLEQVFRIILTVTKIDLSNDPKLALLGLGMDSWPYKFHALLTHFLIAARLSIAHNWKSARAKSIKDVILSSNKHGQFEYAFAKAHLKQEKFLHQWHLWLSHSLCTIQL